MRRYKSIIAEPEVRSNLCSLPTVAKFSQDRRARHFVLSMGKRTGFEHLYCYCGNTGKDLVKHTDRAVDNVGLPKRHLVNSKRRGNRLVLHHNHPRGFSLSTVDIRHLIERPGLVEVFAHGHDGSWYWAESQRRKEGIIMLQHGEIALIKGLKALQRRGVHVEQALPSHFLNLALDRAKILVYKYYLSPSKLAELAKIPAKDTDELLQSIYTAIINER